MFILIRKVVLVATILFSTVFGFSQSNNFEVVKGLELMDLIFGKLVTGSNGQSPRL